MSREISFPVVSHITLTLPSEPAVHTRSKAAALSDKRFLVRQSRTLYSPMIYLQCC